VTDRHSGEQPTAGTPYLIGLDRIKADLERRFPGWHIWYVPHVGGSVTWCAQPWPLINSGSPEQLAAEIIQAHEESAGEWPALANRPDYAASAPGVPQARGQAGGPR
jgi:hypothetical protein